MGNASHDMSASCAILSTYLMLNLYCIHRDWLRAFMLYQMSIQRFVRFGFNKTIQIWRTITLNLLRGLPECFAWSPRMICVVKSRYLSLNVSTALSEYPGGCNLSKLICKSLETFLCFLKISYWFTHLSKIKFPLILCMQCQ